MLTPKEESKQRMKICNSCEYLSAIKTCSKCNCYMPLKTKIHSMSCPIGKWGNKNNSEFDIESIISDIIPSDIIEGIDSNMLDLSAYPMEEIMDYVENIPIKFTEEMVLERLRDRYRWPEKYPWGQPTVSVIDKETGLNRVEGLFSEEDGYINSEVVIDAYHKGETLLISNVGGLFNEIRELQSYLESHFGHLLDERLINVNLYIGKGNDKMSSFPMHSHGYHVIVRNVWGESVWATDDEEHLISGNTAILIPSGTNHCVKSINGSKCSLTCNIEY